MGKSAGLCGDCHVDHGVFCAECVLWVLLRAATAKEVLEYGKPSPPPNLPSPKYLHWRGDLATSFVPVSFKVCAFLFSHKECVLSTDLSRRHGLHHRLHQPQIPHAQLAALPSGHVCRHGSQRRISGSAWHLHVRSGSDAGFDRALLAGNARIPLRVGSGTLRCRFPLSPRPSFPMFRMTRSSYWTGIGSNPRKVESWTLRCLGKLASDLPCAHSAGGDGASDWAVDGLSLSTRAGYVPSTVKCIFRPSIK